MQASSHVKRHPGRQSVEYPIRVTDHAIEKIREIGIDPQHSDGWLRDRIAIQVWDHIKGKDPGECPQIGGNADYIAPLVDDTILGLKANSFAVVVANDRPGYDNAKWAVATILDEKSYEARKEMALKVNSGSMDNGTMEELRKEIIETMHANLAQANFLVVLLDVAGTFMGLRGFQDRTDAEQYINNELADGNPLEGFRVFETRPLQTRVTIGK